MKNLRFYRREYGSGKDEEVTYEQALHIVLGTYRDCDMTMDMLTRGNYIPCQFSEIVVTEVQENGMEMYLMPGFECFVPEGAEYDDNGNRIVGVQS